MIVLTVAAGWLLLAVAVAVLIGRGIRLAEIIENDVERNIEETSGVR